MLGEIMALGALRETAERISTCLESKTLLFFKAIDLGVTLSELPTLAEFKHTSVAMTRITSSLAIMFAIPSWRSV